MQGSSKLGFGMMRLPQLSGEATDIDFAQVNRMVDRFLEAGFTYFDTSWAYHNTASETAVQKCLASRYPRELIITEEHVDEMIEKLEKVL